LKWSDILSTTVKIEYTINEIDYTVISLSATNHNGPEFGQGYYNWAIDVLPVENLIVRISDNEYPDMYVDFDPVNIVERPEYSFSYNKSSFRLGFRIV